jgi:hypothetical protein
MKEATTLVEVKYAMSILLNFFYSQREQPTIADTLGILCLNVLTRHRTSPSRTDLPENRWPD